ncbi:alpha/beta hydrolase [Nocardia sp. JMUB6875]|uniref:alpha/beta fold hydrolase n=1 Tax=Nocardia sp. JMUB6875 TaxID=3158170 RepID=UPI0032E6386D
MGFFGSAEGYGRYRDAYAEAMRLSPKPVETRDVATRFGIARVYRHGPDEGVPIVLVHPFFATATSWAANIAGLAEHHPVYTLDALGQPGLSVQTAPIRTPEDNAACLGEVLGELGLGRVHLVGWSYGGWLSLQLALFDPDRIASLTLVDPANTLARFSLGFRTRLLAIPIVAMAPALDPLVDRFTAWMVGNPDSNDPLRREFLPILQLLQTGARTYRPIGAPFPSYPSDDRLRSLRSPVLALIAGHSAVHDPNAALRRVRTLLPEAQTELWPTATHALPTEFPDEVNQRILGFIAQYD